MQENEQVEFDYKDMHIKMFCYFGDEGRHNVSVEIKRPKVNIEKTIVQSFDSATIRNLEAIKQWVRNWLDVKPWTQI